MRTKQIFAILGLGAGINRMSNDDLRALWQRHGKAVTEFWLKQHGTLPFVAEIAKREGWNERPKPKT
ncbi:MAG: hypothetical protein KIT13_03690 [Burkholderiales bacterium]|nr:hypothetical protein [Burkholderiales bacterium]